MATRRPQAKGSPPQAPDHDPQHIVEGAVLGDPLVVDGDEWHTKEAVSSSQPWQGHGKDVVGLGSVPLGGDTVQPHAHRDATLSSTLQLRTGACQVLGGHAIQAALAEESSVVIPVVVEARQDLVWEQHRDLGPLGRCRARVPHSHRRPVSLGPAAALEQPPDESSVGVTLLASSRQITDVCSAGVVSVTKELSCPIGRHLIPHEQ
eukprot:4783534-Lingulodinium_polyedra.AAC.1